MRKGISIWTINYWNYKYFLLKEFVLNDICFDDMLTAEILLQNDMSLPSWHYYPLRVSLLASQYYSCFLYPSLLHINIRFPFFILLPTSCIPPIFILLPTSCIPLTFLLFHGFCIPSNLHIITLLLSLLHIIARLLNPSLLTLIIYMIYPSLFHLNATPSPGPPSYSILLCPFFCLG